MKLPYILGLVAVAILASVLMVDLFSSASIYSDFAAAKESGSEVHIVGQWVRRDEVVRETNKFQFYLQDTLNHIQQVTYYDQMPPNFSEADRVVINGKYEKDNEFVATHIQMKCPSKYNDAAAAGKQHRES